MESVGLDLKTEREKKKISLHQIAADTRISIRYLQNIEEDRFDDLPGGVYNRAFIKAYCESINMDPQDILKRYDELTAPSLLEKHPKNKIPLPEQKPFPIPGPIVIWSIMLVLSAVGIFFSRHWISDLFLPYFAEKTETNLEYEIPAEFPAGNGQETTVSGEISAPEETASGETGSPPQASTSQPPPLPAEAAPVSRAEPKQTLNADSIDSAAESKLSLEISAKEQCWISVDRDGIPSTRRLMEPGETQVIHAEKRLQVLVGNAGGVEMSINGQAAKQLGNTGEVKRMDITLENLQNFLRSSAN